MVQKRFQNKNPHKKPQGLFSVLKWVLTEKKPNWPKHVPLQSHDHPPERVEDSRIRVSFVGQASFLVQTESLNILTDPIWSQRCGFKHYGVPRVTEPGIHFDNLPKIDLVVISHNHYDHMDIKTIRKLWHRDKPKIIVPLKNELTLQKNIPGIQVETLDWHTSCSITNRVSCHLEPCQHWSRRSLFDQNKALWGTFVIQGPTHSICFIGDSGYDPNIFKEIGNKFNNIRLSIIPIGAYIPRWFMKNVHMNPEEAVLTHQDLKSTYSIASHFETFPLGYDEYKQPAEDLAQAKKQYNVTDDVFVTPKIGEAYWF